MKVPQLIIIRGASGVGKSTILRHLKALLENAFLVDIDSIRMKFSRMDWANGVSDFVNAQKIVRAMVHEALKLGYGYVVVADPFPKELLLPFVKDINFQISVISLFCEPEELLRRLEERGRPILHRERIFNLNNDIRGCDLDGLDLKVNQVIYIDNTKKDERVVDMYIQKKEE